MTKQNNSTLINNYANEIWKTADILRGVGVKQSEWPSYMMPFLALLMIESRILKAIKELESEGVARGDLKDLLKDEGFGYNDVIINQNHTLRDIFSNDSTYQGDFETYLRSFDPETKILLGCEHNDKDNYLDLNGWNKKLRFKDIDYDYIKAWSLIDLTELDNHEITDMEEHIKRKWADISADTSGEQYTPSDIFDLISDLGVEYIKGMYTKERAVFSLYDMTCGGGNMLFGVEDNIKNTLGDLISTETHGQEINTSLYALAKIESRFRKKSYISMGNTLTDPKVKEGSIDLGIANPPYGVDWKQVKNKVEENQTGQYKNYPSTSDGQLLFVQHKLHSLKDDGKAIIVLNGSPLFSGDAGSGESEIRKYIFENDYLEALIQLPNNEFFNTGITTYLWMLNKDKPTERKNKIILINANNMFIKLKKNKGSKNCEIDEPNRKKIVDMFLNCDLNNNDNNNENCKVLNVADFYYNKVNIQLTNVDVNDKSFEDSLDVNSKGVRSKTLKITNVKDILFSDEKYTLCTPNTDLQTFCKEQVQPYLNQIELKNIKILTEDGIQYHFDEEKETIVLTNGEKIEDLGCGVIEVKASYKKATTKNEEFIDVTVEIKPHYEKDNEIIPYSFNETENENNIQEFMDKWVERPYEILGNTVGAEVNFNKVFYKPEVLRPLEDIKSDLLASHDKLSKLMHEVFNEE